jgi:YD repeat-containing protein
MPPSAQLKPKRSRGHARRLGKHPSQYFRTKKASTAAFTGATCYELSSTYSNSATHIVRYIWDTGPPGSQLGNLLQITDAKGNINQFAYDKNNRVIKEVLPLGQVQRGQSCILQNPLSQPLSTIKLIATSPINNCHRCLFHCETNADSVHNRTSDIAIGRQVTQTRRSYPDGRVRPAHLRLRRIRPPERPLTTPPAWAWTQSTTATMPPGACSRSKPTPSRSVGSA